MSNSTENGKLNEFLASLSPRRKEDKVSITINQYDQNDVLVGSYTGDFFSVFDMIDNPLDYYYRLATINTNTIRDKVSDRHLGVNVSCFGGLKFIREDYLNNYLNYMVRCYMKENLWECDFSYIISHYIWIDSLYKNINQNTKERFERFVDQFLKKNPEFTLVMNLNDYNNITGIYFMILDEYKLCYIGQASKSIKSRVMRHWSRNDYFTGTGIDLFKAFDTTRLYALRCNESDIDELEHRLVSMIPERYALNVLPGGTIDYLITNGMNLDKGNETDDTFIDYMLNTDIIGEINRIKNQFVVFEEKNK